MTGVPASGSGDRGVSSRITGESGGLQWRVLGKRRAKVSRERQTGVLDEEGRESQRH